ncbi:hypothetical protein H0E87_020823 [Populus deltoides]|uniref:Cytochrome P450 n=1 Tax=Populus deltoides TaxID=3696 RepID=A0A8T2XMI8_POPDE|nr:hypothetical protein H0E87_020823 [Populus deltoides]
MTLTVTSILVSIVYVAVLRWAWRILNWVWFRPKKVERCLRQQGFAGKPYRLLFGDWKENSDMLKEARTKPIGLSDALLPRVMPFLHQLVKDYGKNSFMWIGPKPRVNIMNPDQIRDVFMKINEYQKPSHPLLKPLACGLASHEGEKWAKHRKIINPAFHQEKLKLMIPAFYESCSGMINKWEKLVSVDEGSCELDVWPDLQGLTCDAISRTSFGSNYEEGKRIFDLLKELTDLTVHVLIKAIVIPGYRFLPIPSNRSLKAIDKEIKASLNALINKREKAMSAGEDAKNDLLVLRLYPPVIMLNRDVHEEIKLGNLLLPAGVQISLPTILLHQDHELWGDDASEFKPERFAEGVSKATKSQVSFLPFGWGPRICVGQNFALIEAKMAVAMVLQRYSFELSPSYIHAPRTVITLQPQHGAPMILRKL